MVRAEVIARGALLALLACPAAADWDKQAPASLIARQSPLPVSTASPQVVRQALEAAGKRHEDTVQRWIAIAEVGALPGHEERRAQIVAQMLRERGLAVRVLPDGNVEAVLPGKAGGMPAVLSAHLDALHEPTAANRVRREEDQLRGPGVLDDASGLAVLVTAARLLVEAGYKPVREVRLVATVGEETGLVGAQSYVAARPDLAAYVSIDGVLGAVDYGATGIKWTKYRLTGRGGHTLLASRTPSPSFAAGRAIASIASLAEETDAPLNIGIIEGGTAANAIPVEVSFTVDLRSDDAETLERLDRDVLRVARAAADREGVELTTQTLQSLPAARLPGHASSPLVTGAAGILEWLGIAPATYPRGSSDHNIALARGIPAIAVGSTAGRHAHAPEEIADIPMLERGVKQAILLIVLLGEGLPEPAQDAAQ